MKTTIQDGYDYAMNEITTAPSQIKLLEKNIEEARDFGTYSDFDKGCEEAIDDYSQQMAAELYMICDHIGDSHTMYHGINECADEYSCESGDGPDLFDQLGLTRVAVNIGGNGMINMPGMVSNYQYAVSVNDGDFIRCFEGMWDRDAVPIGLFAALRVERFTVEGSNVIVECLKETCDD